MNSNGSKLAKEAIVFSVTGINENFKIPVAYFLTAGLKANEKSTLLQEVILFVSKTGVKIVGMVFDGLVANLATIRLLGAEIYNDKLYINNPHSDGKIFVIFDACHMLKLARNYLGTKKTLFDVDDNCINWNYIVELEKFQSESKINLGNKLNKTHIQWERKKMSVRLACETLSNSVADSIDLLREREVEAFQGSEPTTRFIRRINNIFDILNSMYEDAIGFKRPISPETETDFFAYFDESIRYIEGLKLSLNGKSICKTKSKTPFIGFIIDMKNFRLFYLDYVHSGILSSVITFRFSQDHLELIFACVRQMVSYFWNLNYSLRSHIFVLNEIK